MRFLSLTNEEKKFLLGSLGYLLDDKNTILDSNGVPHLCPYTNKEVKLDNASILPGSTIVMTTSAFTLAEYVTENLEDDADSH